MDGYEEVLYTSKDEIQETADALLVRIFAAFSKQMKATIAQIDEDEIEEELWGQDALETLIDEQWADFEPNLGPIEPDLGTEEEL